MLKEATSAFNASDAAAYEHWLGRWSSRLADAFLDFVKFPDDGELLDDGERAARVGLDRVAALGPAQAAEGVGVGGRECQVVVGVHQRSRRGRRLIIILLTKSFYGKEDPKLTE